MRARWTKRAPTSPQAGALCGAPQSSGVDFKTRADAGAAPSTPEGAAALTAARLLGARCVREAVGRALAELRGLRAAAAAGVKAAPASEGLGGDAATESPAAQKSRQPGPLPAAADHNVKAADGAAADHAGPAHRHKRQRLDAGATPEQARGAGAAAGTAAGAVPQHHVCEDDDDYMGDVSDVSMSDDDGNDAAAQRSKGAALLGGLADGAAVAGGDPSRSDTDAGAAQPARQSRAAPAGGEGADRPAKKQKKAKPVQKPKNR